MKLKPRPDGRYCCRYKDKFFYGSSSDVAYAARDAYIKKEAAGQLLRRELTVKDYALKWLPLYKSGVSDKCYNDYAKQLEALFPVIGNLHMSQVTVDDAVFVVNVDILLGNVVSHQVAGNTGDNQSIVH